jgi:putative adhesin
MEPRTFETPAAVLLELRIGSGRIHVNAAKETAETIVHVTGERDPDEVEVETDELPDGGRRIRVEQRGSGLFRRGRNLDVRVVAPPGVVIEAETGSADLEARGSVGGLTFRAGSGDVAFEVIDGRLSVKAGSGDVAGKRVGGDASVATASGNVALARVDGSLILRTASGDVAVGGAGRDVRVTTASGDVEIGTVARGEATVRAVSGDVNIGVASGTAVWMDLSSVTGAATSELEQTDGATGSGAPALELRVATVSGDVRVQRVEGIGRPPGALERALDHPDLNEEEAR